MLDTFLVPEQAVEANGEGPPLELGAAAGQKYLLTLRITRIIEQESLDVSLWGSEDGANWGTAPLIAFPQKFYAGTHQLLLDLAEQPAVKFLRAQWKVNRWGKGQPTPHFTFSVAIQQLTAKAAA